MLFQYGGQRRELWRECEQRGLHVVHPGEPGDAAHWLEVRTIDGAASLSRAFDLLLDQPWSAEPAASAQSSYSATRHRPATGPSLPAWKSQP